LRFGKGLDGSSKQVPTDAGPSDGDYADLLVAPVAEPFSQFISVSKFRLIESGDISDEVVVLAWSNPG
jgi:hypothetical protein